MRPQPVEITVSDLRDAVWRASATASQGGPTAAAGTLFHGAASKLLSGDRAWHTVLTDANLADDAVLRRHAYERILGPHLTRMEAALKESGRETLWVWNAVAAACRWLCGILKAAQDQGWIRYDQDSQSWRGVDRLIASEQPVSREFQLENWQYPVLISGVPDAVLRDPRTGRWCCLEFKLGAGSAPADLCQAALYQLLLGSSAGDGDIALVRFTPEVSELVIQSESLNTARNHLLTLAGKIAGAVRPERTLQDVRQNAIRYTATKQQEAQIIRTLRTFGAEVTSAGNPIVGPTFIRFQLKPAPGVPVKKILTRSEDIGIQLGISPPWIEQVDGAVAVDVPRQDREAVPFSMIRLRRDPVQGGSQVPIGVDLNMQVRMVDLSSSDSPHVLVVGTAGSGKTEWLRTAVAALILSNTPNTLRFVLVDPKRLAFRDLANSPFLWTPESLVLPPDGSTMEALDLLSAEMENRYRLFASAAVDDLHGWRARTGGVMPRIVCVMDEFADMMADPRDRRGLEDRVVRLGAKARAAGIHLILATQHPDHKTVTTRLQANLSVRVCLRTTTRLQSQVALKQGGGERLLGKGDLFYSIGDRMWRMQAAYLGDDERSRIFSGSASQL